MIKPEHKAIHEAFLNIAEALEGESDATEDLKLIASTLNLDKEWLEENFPEFYKEEEEED